MAISNIYSKRQKKLRGEISDVYSYDKIPKELRIQIMHIIKNTIDRCATYYEMQNHYYKWDHPDIIYKKTYDTLIYEYGVMELDNDSDTYYSELFNFFLHQNDIEKCFDIIELSFIEIDGYVREKYNNYNQELDEAINELNYRFREHGIGYQLEQGEIIRVDSQIIHSNIIKPVINLLSSDEFYNGANEEYLSAHEHYRHKRYKECLTDCCKSFESMLKAIHEMNNWEYKKSDSASKLIKSCLDKELIPSYIQSQFTSLKTMLESGVPTIRNNMSGHGQGTENKEVSEELVSYMLHLTATNLLFIADSQKKYQQNN
ncbi:TPA: HEPN domain-containing protein [Proteus mirabilis]|nr:HEPN domain-containing protein [Proteus mirabilis]